MSKARDIASAIPAPSTISSTELGYLDGVTSAIQTQINTKSAIADDFAAGKNKIINGDFGIWQRGTSFTATGTYNADRWNAGWDSSPTVTISRQTFTPGTAPVAGYEGQFFQRTLVSVASSMTLLDQKQYIEDVRTFAGQTVTVSFWAKADAARAIKIFLGQNFGSGGSSQVDTAQTTINATTSWARYSATITLASVSGKTIGTSSYLALYLRYPGSTFTIDIWGVQIEAGSTASPFQTATGTIQGELAACQRYFQKSNNQSEAPGTAPATTPINAVNVSTTIVAGIPTFKVSMRASPTVTLYSAATGTSGKIRSGGADITATAADVGENSIGYISATGLTAGSNSTIAYTASAEL